MKKMSKEEKIQYANCLIEEITSKFLQKDRPYIIMEGYEYLREVVTLYAKQSNLFESTLLLLENNHAEEAYVLVRSMLNNLMVIDYLCNDDEEKERYKNYMIQPVKAELAFLMDISKAITKGWIKESQYPDLRKNIKERKEFLRKEGFVKDVKGKEQIDTNMLSIRGMALTDELLFGHYTLFYREASKFEHSDVASLDIYRTPVTEEYPNTVAFILDLSKTDSELEEKVINLSVCIYSFSYLTILKHLTNHHPYIIPEENKATLFELALFIHDNSIHFPINVISNTFNHGKTYE
jgi:hypothetical protein